MRVSANRNCTDGSFECYDSATVYNVLMNEGIDVYPSGNCMDKLNPNCTSFDALHRKALHDFFEIAQASDCPVTVTGGTEIGQDSDGKLIVFFIRF